MCRVATDIQARFADLNLMVALVRFNNSDGFILRKSPETCYRM